MSSAKSSQELEASSAILSSCVAFFYHTVLATGQTLFLTGILDPSKDLLKECIESH